MAQTSVNKKENPMSIVFSDGRVMQVDPVAPTGTGIDVSPFCLQSYPCQHDVSVDGAKSKMMVGVEIAQLYVKRGLKVPKHFAGYQTQMKPN